MPWEFEDGSVDGGVFLFPEHDAQFLSKKPQHLCSRILRGARLTRRASHRTYGRRQY